MLQSTFIFVNRDGFFHNINIVCLSINIYVRNRYTLPSPLFITGVTEIKSSEGTTQSDPVATPSYPLSVIPFMLMILEITCTKANSDAKTLAYADDF